MAPELVLKWRWASLQKNNVEAAGHKGQDDQRGDHPLQDQQQELRDRLLPQQGGELAQRAGGGHLGGAADRGDLRERLPRHPRQEGRPQQVLPQQDQARDHRDHPRPRRAAGQRPGAGGAAGQHPRRHRQDHRREVRPPRHQAQVHARKHQAGRQGHPLPAQARPAGQEAGARLHQAAAEALQDRAGRDEDPRFVWAGGAAGAGGAAAGAGGRGLREGGGQGQPAGAHLQHRAQQVPRDQPGLQEVRQGGHRGAGRRHRQRGEQGPRERAVQRPRAARRPPGEGGAAAGGGGQAREARKAGQEGGQDRGKSHQVHHLRGERGVRHCAGPAPPLQERVARRQRQAQVQGPQAALIGGPQGGALQPRLQMMLASAQMMSASQFNDAPPQFSNAVSSSKTSRLSACLYAGLPSRPPDLLALDGGVELAEALRVELVEGAVEYALLDPGPALIEVLLEEGARGLGQFGAAEGLVVLAGHVEDEVVVDLAVDPLDLLRGLGVPAEAVGVVAAVLHGHFGVLAEVLLVGAEVVEAAPPGLEGGEVGRQGGPVAGVDGPRGLRAQLALPPDLREARGLRGRVWLLGLWLVGERVHDVEYFLVGLGVEVLADDEGVDGLPAPHVPVDVDEVVGVVEVERVVLEGQAVLDEPVRQLAGLPLEDLLQVDSADVVEDPLDLEVHEVDAAGHRQEVHDLVGHELHVLAGAGEHEVHRELLQRLDVPVVLVVAVDCAQQHHHLLLGLAVERCVEERAVGVLGVVDGLGLLLVLDVGLEEAGVVQLGRGREGEGLELGLVEELAVAVVELDDAEGLLLVHLVLLDLLDLVLGVGVQDVPAEVALVAVEGGAVVARVEVRRHQLLEVLEVHELRVDLVQHLLVVVLLQQALVLPPHPQERRQHQLQRSKARQLHHPSVLPAGLEDLQRLPVHEEDVRQEQLQRLGPADRQPLQQPLEPPRGLPAVRPEEVLVGPAGRELPREAEVALALVLAGQVVLRVDGLLEVADHQRGGLLAARLEQRGPLVEQVAHGYQNYQLSMDSAGLSLEQSSFRRSGLSSTRQKASSDRTSGSQHGSLRHKLQAIVLDSPEEQLDIYFNRTKRRAYFRQVIDGYFQPEPSAPRSLCPPDLRRDSATCDSPKRGRRTEVSISQLRLKERQSMLDFGSGNEVSSLPVISEGAKGPRRPTSEYKQSSLLSIDRDMDESLFCESNKSVLERSSQSEAIQQFQHYKVVPLRKGGRSVGRSRIFSSGDNEQLLRQLAAKRLGMQLLWKSPLSNQELQYPAAKSLRELCCSTVEDRNGEEPLFLIYPTPYYFALFANANEELRDIVAALARTIASAKGSIANNQVSPKNVVRLQEKQFLLADWGCAALRESLTVQGRTFTKDLPPLCRGQNKWLLAPQYLAPELLRACRSGNYGQLWEQKGGISACDVWSLGCLVYELVTLVPLGSPHFCAVKGREERRRGLLGCRLPTAEKLLARQKNLRTLVLRGVREQMRLRKEVRLSEKLLQLLPRMLEESPERRISAEEIMAALA